MDNPKYYDYKKKQTISLETDGCRFADWPRECAAKAFAHHPSGFKIFLSPDSLAGSDEYQESDPYKVEENLTGEFHSRRVEITVELIREAAGNPERDIKVLDIGCGEGHITDLIHKNIGNAEISGMDHAVSAISYAHSHFADIDFIVADAYSPPYQPEYFDVIVCNNLWEHVPDPVYFLTKVQKVLKPGGHVIISTPSRYRTDNLVRALRGKPVSLISRYHITEYTVGQVKEQLAYNGFTVVKITSKPIAGWSLKYNLARALFRKLVSLTNSHHQLESTVFYLARKENVKK